MTNGKSASSSGIVVDAVQAGAGNDTLSGAALDDNLRGGAGNDVLTGRDGNDALLGEAGNDKLDGGAGTDRLDGGDGNDTLLAGDGADLLAGGSGADSLTAGTGNDSLSGGDANDTLDAGAGNDSILGGVGNDAILGGDGDDWAEGNEGADSLTAGIGNDTLSAGADADKLLGEAGQDSLSGGDGNDSLDGGLGNDTLLGDAGNDTLIGGDDADRLMGGAGADVLTGGKGADVFVVDADGGDTILDWSVLDGDRLDLTGVLASLSYSGSDAFADGVLVWKQGATGAVLWAGSVALVTLTGKFAADTQLLAGTSPDSTYQFRDGMLAGQRATLTDATGIDRIDLSLLGSGVTLDMNAAKGGLIAGGTLVLGSGVIENITGTEFDDVLTGNVAGNVMIGGAGADVLTGGSGNDMLTGGAGLDRLNGGIGADVFRLSTEAAADRIDDFKTTEGDRLDLTDVLATLGLTLAGAVSANRIVLEQDSLGSSLRVDLGGAGEYITIAWLAGVSGATAIANLVSGAKTTAPPMLVRTDVAVAAMAEAGDISWNVLKAVDWTPTGGSLTTSTGLTAYDLSQVAGAALVTMATGTGTLKGATLAFRGAVTDLITGDLADKITTGTGADRVWSLGGNDTLTGGTGNNLLSGGAGEDSLRAAAGQDSLFGGAGNDKIYGEDGNDSLLGDVGNDLLDGGTGTDLILGGEGRDTLMGQAGHDTLSGGSDNDSLDGGTDNDLLTGEAGDDTLLGGTGNDTLQGDDGADKLTGGTGADRFVFASLVGCDLVTDFKATDGDRLDLSGIVDDFGFASTQDALAHGALRVMVVGTATCVQIAGSDGAWVNVALLDKIIAPSLVPEWLA